MTWARKPAPLTLQSSAHASLGCVVCATLRYASPLAAAPDACTALQLDGFVIGLELCPFARSARRGTRVVVCRAATADAALAALWPEVRRLEAAPLDAPATTLFALPEAHASDWDAFMALHERAEQTSSSQAVQLVPFHPDAAYSDAERDAAEFATRSPVPIIHLLRWSDVHRAEAEWEGGDIVSENADRLRGQGVGALAGLLASFRRMMDAAE